MIEGIGITLLLNIALHAALKPMVKLYVRVIPVFNAYDQLIVNLIEMLVSKTFNEVNINWSL